MRVIRKNLIKKSLDMFNELAEDMTHMVSLIIIFKNLKLGIHEDSTNRSKIAKLLRYHSTTSGDTMTTLDDYVEE